MPGETTITCAKFFKNVHALPSWPIQRSEVDRPLICPQHTETRVSPRRTNWVAALEDGCYACRARHFLASTPLLGAAHPKASFSLGLRPPISGDRT